MRRSMGYGIKRFVFIFFTLVFIMTNNLSIWWHKNLIDQIFKLDSFFFLWFIHQKNGSFSSSSSSPSPFCSFPFMAMLFSSSFPFLLLLFFNHPPIYGLYVQMNVSLRPLSTNEIRCFTVDNGIPNNLANFLTTGAVSQLAIFKRELLNEKEEEMKQTWIAVIPTLSAPRQCWKWWRGWMSWVYFPKNCTPSVSSMKIHSEGKNPSCCAAV